MRRLLPCLAGVLAVTLSPAAAAQADPASDAARSAEAFSLDLPPGEAPVDGPVDAPSAEEAAEAPPAPATPPAADIPPSDAKFSIDTPIDTLIGDYRSKAVLDRDMPGLPVDKNLDKFRMLTLRGLAPLSDGRLGPDLLAKVQADLIAIR